MLAVPAVATWPADPVPPLSWLAAVTLGVLCTGFAYFLFFRLLQRISATRAATCNYLIPVFGVGWAWLLLGETPTLTMLVSGVLILGSVIFSQREAVRPA
jgi:drug/metabolite transporter (DMT)-like permease